MCAEPLYLFVVVTLWSWWCIDQNPPAVFCVTTEAFCSHRSTAFRTLLRLPRSGTQGCWSCWLLCVAPFSLHTGWVWWLMVRSCSSSSVPSSHPWLTRCCRSSWTSSTRSACRTSHCCPHTPCTNAIQPALHPSTKSWPCCWTWRSWMCVRATRALRQTRNESHSCVHVQRCVSCSSRRMRTAAINARSAILS